MTVKKVEVGDKWRLDLLSSSLPLEYLAARKLVAAELYVRADFSYRRSVAGEDKEFSIDISASGYSPFNDPNRLDAELQLLIECKYRRPGSCVLFFQDPNHPDMSSFTLGHTIRTIDQFSPDRIPVVNELLQLDERRKACYKGVEIALEAWERTEHKDRVDDSRLRHGIGQLQYAIPEALRQHIERGLSYPKRLGEKLALFLVPIYVTTAPLYLAHKSVNASAILAAKEIDDIASEVSSIILLQDYGPDYERHWRETFVDLSDYNDSKDVDDFSALRASTFDLRDFMTTRHFMSSMVYAERSELFGLATQFIVCTFTAFPRIVAEIKRLVNATVAKRARLSEDLIAKFAHSRKKP